MISQNRQDTEAATYLSFPARHTGLFPTIRSHEVLTKTCNLMISLSLRFLVLDIDYAWGTLGLMSALSTNSQHGSDNFVSSLRFPRTLRSGISKS